MVIAVNIIVGLPGTLTPDLIAAATRVIDASAISCAELAITTDVISVTPWAKLLDAIPGAWQDDHSR